MDAQSYLERQPDPALGGLLTCVWVQEVGRDAAPYTHRTVPNGSAELVYELGGALRVVGPQTGPTEETLAPGSVVVGVRFRPGAAPAVLGMPASELVDVSVEADAVGRGVEGLAERIAAAATPQAAAAVLEAEVRGLVVQQPDPLAAEAVRRLLPWRGDEVAALPGALHISERQLRRRFEASVGFAPKVLQRMLRFQGFLALTARNHGPGAELAMLAAEAGFADQSHLTRESVRLAGRSPAVLMREAAEHCDGHHDHSASYGPLLNGRAT